jgi:hypothetical protein
LGVRINKAPGLTHDIQALGTALLYVLNGAERRDHEPLTTAIALAGMIEEQGGVPAERIDTISLQSEHGDPVPCKGAESHPNS